MSLTKEPRKPCYVQRMYARTNPEMDLGVDGAFHFEYMGSAEFEFGALARLCG